MTHWEWRKTRRIAPDILLGFAWQGGPYIDVCVVDGGWHTPVEVINVWDYERGAPRIPVTKAAMSEVIDDWIGEYGRKDLRHDVRENWGTYV